MSISFQSLCERLGCCVVGRSKENSTSIIRSAILYDAALSSAPDDCLVIGTSEELFSIRNNMFKNYLCTRPTTDFSIEVNPSQIGFLNMSAESYPSPSVIFRHTESNIAYSTDIDSPMELLHAVREELDFEDKYLNASNELFLALASAKDISDLVDVASGIMKNPIVVADNSFHVLALSKYYQTNDSLWAYFKEHHCYPSEYLDFLTTTRHYTDIYQNPPKTISRDMDFMKPYYSLPLVFNDKQRGFVTLIEENHTITEHDKALLKILVRAISLHMKISPLYSFDKQYQYLLNELLLDEPTQQEIDDRLKFSGIKPLKYLCIYVFQHEGTDINLSPEHMLQELEATIPFSKGVIKDNEIILLIMSDSIEFIDVDAPNRVQPFIKKYKLILGISNIYSNIRFTKRHFTQANTAIRLGKQLDKKQKIYDYTYYSQYHILEILSSTHNIKDFCHPLLLEIYDYDRVHNTEYIKTIEAYVNSNFNLNKTATAMHTHRNTVVYRLGKLQELFFMDSSDIEKMTNFAMTFAILRYLKIIN